MNNDDDRKKSLRVKIPVKVIKQYITGSPGRIQKNLSKYNEKELIDKSIEKDLLLEAGNPLDFLKSNDVMESMGYIKSDTISRHSSVGSYKIFEKYREKSDHPSASSLKQDNLKRRLTIRQSILKVPSYFQLQSHINDINQRITQDLKEHNKKVSSLPLNDKISYFKQEKSLSNFEKKQKEWSKIQGGLTKRIKKPLQKLLCSTYYINHKKDLEKKSSWFMTLRQDQNVERFESFMPVGHYLNGLYLRNFVNAKPKNYFRTFSCDDLKVTGQSKLPLEIEALKRPGSRVSTNHDVGKTEPDEIFAENYDFNHKFLRII
ncbi:hypothetical protein SteCoe_22619 [Stentor coeruleus]|uniref:Uncharacterized protein n=1 Tax=Stentor coeruleus TaxID=5963 RepID=A0A1R2BLS8_9CILI|nr:hypothetical protein SteCoe_22619 [Stentor coeruleus]